MKVPFQRWYKWLESRFHDLREVFKQKQQEEAEAEAERMRQMQLEEIR